MRSVEQIVTDPTLRDLMGQHFRSGQRLDCDLATRVKTLLPSDNFSASQYLLGIEYFRRRLEAVFPPGGSLLDVGCGAGVWSVAASHTQKRVIGTDVDPPRLHCARAIKEKHGAGEVCFLRCSLPEVPVRREAMDAILCHNVLQIVAASHARVLEELRRVARPGARLHIWVTDIGYLGFLRDQALRSRSFRRTVTWLRLGLEARLFSLGLRTQPRAWMPVAYLVEIAKRTGWRRLDEVAPLNVTSSFQSIFPATYRGVSFGSDYLFEAI